MKSEFQELKERAWEANLEIPRRGLAIYTFGNVSAFDPARGVVAIKPSGVDYDQLSIEDMVVIDLDGKTLEGELRPSSDTRTHLVLYRAFQGIGGIVHTHSTYATGWAQACSPIPIFGTTHADHLAEDVPCTEIMSEQAVRSDYELETGNQILACFQNRDPLHTPMVLVAGHGPFTWGATPAKAVYHAVVLEE
jgi:L-ribulose-5-phosphate 4-epimerase